MITIIDYGAGNIASVQKAMEFLGVRTKVSSSPEDLFSADGAILPGVGSFGAAMDGLRARGLESPVKEFINSGRPFFGICLGLQLLFEESLESPGVKGLGVLKGRILKIPQGVLPGGERLKIPHMGWNSLDIKKEGGIFRGMEGTPYVYFVHSYYLKAEEDVVTSTAYYGTEIHAGVQKGNLFACQFHPEKSGSAGLLMLKNFAAEVENVR